MSQPKDVCAFVLAGGASSRMGHDKALLELEGLPLLVRAVRLLESIVSSVRVIAPEERYHGLGLRLVPDQFPGEGPLGGIVTALASSQTPWNLIVACDLPYLTPAWLEYLIARALASRADVVAPESAKGLEPLCAMYHKRSESAIAAMFGRGVRKVTGVLEAFPSAVLQKVTRLEWKAFDSEGLLFKNMNSPADYEQARARIETRRMGNREPVRGTTEHE